MATGTSGTERTIGQLVADATHDLEGIVRGEIALAKAEVTDGAKVLGKGAGLLAGAAFLALMGLVFLLHSAAWGIAEWLPVWAGYLIVAVVVLIIAAVLGLLGKKALETARPAPERAIDQAQQTIAVIKEPFGDSDAVDATTGAPASGTASPASGNGSPKSGTAVTGRHRWRTGLTDALSLTGTRPVDTVRRRGHPAAQHRRDLVEGERVAGVRVVERGREDHPDDVAARVDHRSAGGAAAHLGTQRVDLAARPPGRRRCRRPGPAARRAPGLPPTHSPSSPGKPARTAGVPLRPARLPGRSAGAPRSGHVEHRDVASGVEGDHSGRRARGRCPGR